MIKRCFIGETLSNINAPIIIHPIISNGHGTIPDLKSQNKDARTDHLGFVFNIRSTNTWGYMLNSFAHQPQTTHITSSEYRYFDPCFKDLEEDMKKRDYVTHQNAVLMHESIINEGALIGEFKKAIKDANEVLAQQKCASLFLVYYANNHDYYHHHSASKKLQIQIDTDSTLSSGEAYKENAVARIYTDEGESFDFNPNGSMILVDGGGINVFEINLCPEEGLYWENTY